MRAQDVHNLVRTERAFCFFRSSTRIQIARADRIENDRLPDSAKLSEAGTIIRIDDGVVVQANDGAIVIKAFRHHGKIISAGSWAREHGVTIGEKFI
jgi:methionyl-tRNA formyltransferase